MARWDIFCRVIDNYGDIAVSWRLARQLAAEYGFVVRLWIDQPATLHKLVPAVNAQMLRQQVDGVDVLHWTAQSQFNDAADVVIEAFGCGLPDAYVALLAVRATQTGRPHWIVLEYLSAEPWVAQHHGMPSPHPRVDVARHFFFPGVAAGTGGLLREGNLLLRHAAFERDAWWRQRGYGAPPHDALAVSLFAYAHAPYVELLEALRQSARPVVLAVPEGFATSALREAAAGAANIELRFLPFLSQWDYDELLWACDINFVRGEDSFVRAQWAAAPFVWHIYPQEAAAHAVKMEAFLNAYEAYCGTAAATPMRALWQGWNNVPESANLCNAWADFTASLPAQCKAAEHWREGLLKLGDVAGNLVQFVKKTI